MCGIIAYKGHRDATQIAKKGLKTLEYRGYDSWGFACIDGTGDFYIKKNVGAIGEVSDLSLIPKGRRCHIAMAHTRWATTGKVTVRNAHPHLSDGGRIAVVQNGIVENYEELKRQLEKKGFRFKSETDTEVIANLIEHEFAAKKGGSNRIPLREAVRRAFKKLTGRNAIIVLDKITGEMIAARFGSPLIIGMGKDEIFIASDIPAFLEYTNKVMYLDDGQLVEVKGKVDGVKSGDIAFYDIQDGHAILRRLVIVDIAQESVDKGSYLHFMIKEIMEQKNTIRRAVNQDDREIQRIAKMINNAFGTFSVACGTAGYVSMIGEYLFAKVAQKHINFNVASEFAWHAPFLTSRTLMIVTSQSGETADVLEAMEAAHREKVKIVSLVNVAGSSIAKKSDYSFNINAGPERAVASTKAATSQIALHTLLAYAVAGKLVEGKQLLTNAAGLVNDMLNPRYERHIRQLAVKLKKTEDIYVIGRGLMYPVALEIALKIKEVSYVHADGLSGGELKHGTLALIAKKTPCIVVVANDENKNAILSNTGEVKARGGYIIGISSEQSSLFDYYIRVPDLGNAAPIASIIAGQILAYHLSVLRGCNPDKPRNLAKSVTVK